MKIRWKLLIAAVAAVASVQIISAESPGAEASPRASQSDSAAVARVVQDFQGALKAGDSTAALALLAPDATVLESGGLETRSDYRSHHLADDIDFARSVKSVRSPLTVTVTGNTAWTAATSTTNGRFRGKEINSVGAESMVLTRSGTGWRIRSIHWSSRTRAAPKA